jgi:hypothetical protein
MVNTKLVLLLKTLSKTEIIKFRELVNSPFYNKNQNVIRLCDELVKFHPSFDSDQCTEKEIFGRMFKKEEYNYFKIKNLISDLYQLSMTFLKLMAFEKRGVENETDLLNELHERKLDSLYLQKEKQVKKIMDERTVKDEFFCEAQYQLARVTTSHYKFEKSNYTFDLIQNEFDIFLRYALIVLLRTYSKMLTNKNHGNVDFKMEMFEQIWEYVKDKKFDDNPSCKIYKQIIALELSRDEKDYRLLMSYKEKIEKSLSDEDIYYILLVANSFAVYKLRLGDESFYRERFNIFKEMVDRNIASPDYILYINFISNYTSACIVDEYEWAEDFLNRFQKGISPAEERTNTINYCRGFLAYRMKDYGKALEYFSKTNFKLFLVKVMVRSYTVRIYYEQDMHEQTLSSIDAFRHYLKSEKMIAEEQKIAHYEFLKYVSELTKLKAEGFKNKSDNGISLIRKEIKKMQSNPLGVKNWLIEKSENFKA